MDIDKKKLRDTAFILQPHPPIDYIVEGVFATKTLNQWAGKYGHKKTWAGLYLTACIATGIEFLGRKTKRCPVLIIDEESGEDRLCLRLQSILKTMDADASTPINFLSLEGFNLSKFEKDIEKLVAYIKETQAGFVLIDALVDIMLGGDENSAKDTQPVMRALRGICQDTNTSILLLHHHNKSSKVRGSTAITAALDSATNIIANDNNGIIKFRPEKTRDGKAFEADAECHWANGLFWMDLSDKANHGLTPAEQYVMDWANNHDGGVIITDMERDGKYKKQTLKNALTCLAKEGGTLYRKDLEKYGGVYTLVG